MDDIQFIIEVDKETNITEDKMSFEDPIPLLLDTEEKELSVRIDKWLWAARFFKTRALARSAVKSGKIFHNGKKTIPNKEIDIGDTIMISDNKFNKMVVIRGLSTRRCSAEKAQNLFEELKNDKSSKVSVNSTEESKSKRVVRFLRRALLKTDEQNNTEKETI